MKLTKNRHAWLKLLATGERPSRNRSNVGFSCMRAGWSEWNYRSTDGEEMTGDEARARYGDRWWDHVRIHGERLTEAGRLVLDEADDDA